MAHTKATGGSDAGATAVTGRVEGDLDRAAAGLVGEGGEGVPPGGQAERVGQHPGEVDPAGGGEVEVVLDAVLADALDLLDAEGVGADQADLLEVERAPLPSARGRGRRSSRACRGP